MLILWIRKKKTDEPDVNEKKEDESFKTHNDIIKRFRMAHPDLNIVSARDILTSEGSLLAPIERVKLTDHAQN